MDDCTVHPNVQVSTSPLEKCWRSQTPPSHKHTHISTSTQLMNRTQTLYRLETLNVWGNWVWLIAIWTYDMQNRNVLRLIIHWTKLSAFCLTNILQHAFCWIMLKFIQQFLKISWLKYRFYERIMRHLQMLAVATQTSSSHQTAAILINMSKLFLLKEDERFITAIYFIFIFLVSLFFFCGEKRNYNNRKRLQFLALLTFLLNRNWCIYITFKNCSSNCQLINNTEIELTIYCIPETDQIIF